MPAVLFALDRRPPVRAGRGALRERRGGGELRPTRLRPVRKPLRRSSARGRLIALTGSAHRRLSDRPRRDADQDRSDDRRGLAGEPVDLQPGRERPQDHRLRLPQPVQVHDRRQANEIYVDNVGNGTDEEIDRFPLAPSQPYNSGWPCNEGLERNPSSKSWNCRSVRASTTQRGRPRSRSSITRTPPASHPATPVRTKVETRSPVCRSRKDPTTHPNTTGPCSSPMRFAAAST